MNNSKTFSFIRLNVIIHDLNCLWENVLTIWQYFFYNTGEPRYMRSFYLPLEIEHFILEHAPQFENELVQSWKRVIGEKH